MNRNHLKQKNTTYFRHLKQAWKEAMCCGLAADLLFVHGLFPWIFDKYFSSYIARAHRKLSNAAWGSITIGME